MLLLLSPAKTLDYAPTTGHHPHSHPRELAHSLELIAGLREFSVPQLASLMKLSEPLAALNIGRYHSFSPQFTMDNSKQALFAFMGDVYEGLAAHSLDGDTLAYAQQRLRILSGLYGVLRPLDLMQPYRLEMGTRLQTQRGSNLYQFWGDRPTDILNTDLAERSHSTVVNLASEEYFKVIKPKKLQAQLVQCVFEDFKTDRYKIISFYAKRARGLMARYILQNRIDQIDGLKDFTSEGYAYCPEQSGAHQLVFRRMV